MAGGLEFVPKKGASPERVQAMIGGVVVDNAAGDGVTDDTAVIRAKITAAGVNGRVVFPGPKTYLVSNQLVPLAGQRWEMNGATLTIPNQSTGSFTANDTYVQGSGALNDVRAVIAIVGVDGVTISGVTIDGNGDNQTSANVVKFAGILVHDADDITIENCIVDDIMYGGYTADNTTRQWGVLFSKSVNSRIIGGSFSHCGYECVGVRDACRDIKIIGAICDDGVVHAAQATSSGRTVTITRSSQVATVSLPGHGFATGDIVSFSGSNQAEYNIRAAITVVDANSFTYTVSGTPTTPATGTITAALRPRNISFIGCTFIMPVASSGDGLIFHDADSCQAIGCGFVEAQFHDITSNDSVVSGCSFETLSRTISIVNIDGANRPRIVDNAIQGNGLSPVQGLVVVVSTESSAATHGLVLSRNTIKNGSRGFQADPPASTDCFGWIITENLFDTVSTPIRLRGQVVRALIAGNTIRRTPSGAPTGNGIDIADTCTTCTIRDNDMTAISAQASRIVLAGSFPTTHVLRDNPGYPTRASGVVSVADGGTITHGLAATPTRYGVTATTSGEFASVTAAGSTTITVAIKKHDNTAGTTQNIAWWAEV